MKKITQDLNAYGTGLKLIAVALWNRGFQAMLIYRISHFFSNIKLTPVSAVLTRLIQILYGIDIHWNAEIDGGCRILHGVGLVVSKKTKIGKNCTLYHGVTIGVKEEWQFGEPIIGNNVKIYTGAKIIGEVVIGDNVMIGANAVVTENCEANSIYAGVPAKRVKARS
ncbi:MAG: hypothetical protein A2Y40_05365 [Candidatus Margulisbacteria bacterium GWF2_35_9]|nr:MAG: hypothetical protein A2Y40_05365 [Candidatus Margulisbacteria bacterium GWF2_35_9]